jgi:hypothetical protein
MLCGDIGLPIHWENLETLVLPTKITHSKRALDSEKLGCVEKPLELENTSTLKCEIKLWDFMNA